jgi:hypothetical protein
MQTIRTNQNPAFDQLSFQEPVIRNAFVEATRTGVARWLHLTA